jgi:hypothetical protein
VSWQGPLSVWCGRGAHNKQVPHFILHHKNKEVLSAFLDGYWAGDGCVEHRQYGALRQMAITASSKLALEIQLLGARLGHYIMEGGIFSAEQGQLLEIADQKLMNNIKISLESPLEP